MTLIKPLGPELEEYVRDESRHRPGMPRPSHFPSARTRCETCCASCMRAGTPVTVQGARTGLAAGAVPQGGHVLNLSRMDAVLGLRRGEDGTYRLRVQPGRGAREPAQGACEQVRAHERLGRGEPRRA